MTARFMRAGRFAHRSPHVRGLYLAGSSTHPGPVGQLLRDLGRARRRLRRSRTGLMLNATLETTAGRQRCGWPALGSGPPLVLLHGYPDNLQIWCDWRRAWRPLRDASPSTGPAWATAMPGRAARRRSHMADRLRRCWTPGGSSAPRWSAMDMGGQPALAFAARYPERMRTSGRDELAGDVGPGDLVGDRMLRRFGWNRVLLRRLPWLVFERAVRTSLPRGVRLPPDLRPICGKASARTRCAIRGADVRRIPGHAAALAGDCTPGRLSDPAAVGGTRRHFPPVTRGAAATGIQGRVAKSFRAPVTGWPGAGRKRWPTGFWPLMTDAPNVLFRSRPQNPPPFLALFSGG